MTFSETKDTENWKKTISPEQELLLYCARTSVDSVSLERMQTLLSQELNWDYLWQMAHCHAIAPLFYWNLKATYPEKVPSKQLQRLQEFFHFNSQRNLILVQELIRLLQLFTEQVITVLPYRGIVLAASAYGNLSLRQMDDLDMLVREQDLSQATTLLAAQGYRITFQLPWEYHFTKPNSIHNIDLHCPLFSETVFTFPDPEWVWHYVEPLTLAGSTLPNLSPETTLLILSLNANKDYWRQLGKISDIAALLRSTPGFDWEKLISQQAQLGSKRTTFLGIFLAKTLLSAPVPDKIWQQIQSDSIVANLATQVISQFTTGISMEKLNQFIFQLKVRERLPDRLRLLSQWLRPYEIDSPSAIPLTSGSFVNYLLRPVQLLRKYGIHNAIRLIVLGALPGARKFDAVEKLLGRSTV